MAADGNTIIVFLERSFLSVWDGTKSLNLNFPSNVVYDLDVLNREAFNSLVLDFLKKNKLAGKKLILLPSSSICFVKDIILPKQIEEKDLQEFIDSVPFEEVLSKVYSVKNGVRIVAVNGRLVDSVVDAFTAANFTESIVVALPALENLSTKRNLDKDIVDYIVKKNGELSEFSMQDFQKSESFSKDEVVSKNSGKKPKTIVYLLAVFFVLLIILGLVILGTRR